MNLCITPSRLSGAVTPPPSKSIAHRLILSAALADGTSTIQNVALSQDIEATLRCAEALGAQWCQPDTATIQVEGIGSASRSFPHLPEFDCGESGSTLRFLIPIALAVAGGGSFRGHGRLMQRPQKPYFDLFQEKGIAYRQSDGVLTVEGTLVPGEYRLPGNVSSQFFTGLLFALSRLDAPSRLVSTTVLESYDYITMTLDALSRAGVSVRVSPDRRSFDITPAPCRAIHAAVEADWSQAAFWYAAAFLDNPLRIEGLHPLSAQGDRIVSDLYWQLARSEDDVDIDLSGCPDLLPPLAVMAAARQGVTRFINGARLRIKESDRLTTTAALLAALGVSVRELPDGLIVQGGQPFTGGTVDGANDHRIVMAAAVAATACSAPVTILGVEAVCKSYPSFWEEYQRLGGTLHVL